MSTVPRLQAGRHLAVAADGHQVDAGEGAAGLDARQQLEGRVDAGVAVGLDRGDERAGKLDVGGGGRRRRAMAAEASTITPA